MSEPIDTTAGTGRSANLARTKKEVAGGAGRRLLVYRIGHLGDTVIALPAIWAIRNHFPLAHLALLGNAKAKSVYTLAASVLPAEGLLDQFITYPGGTGWIRSSRCSIDLFFELRRQRFDTLIYLAPRVRRPLQVRRDMLFFYGAGIRHFIGHKGCSPLPERRQTQMLPVLEHEADHLLHRLALSGIPVPADGQGLMNLKLTAAEAERARAWLKEHCGEPLGQHRLVGISPSSKWPSKVWPEERFAELGKRLVKELDLFPVVFGGREDRSCGERLIDIWGRGANAAGELSVREAAAALRLCSLFCGNDTGPMHLAAAVGTPCVVAFSAQDWPGRWYPYGQGHMILREAVPCEGCKLHVCDQDLLCLRSIQVDQVFKACLAAMKKDNVMVC